MSEEYLEALNGLFDLVHCQDSFEKAQKYGRLYSKNRWCKPYA